MPPPFELTLTFAIPINVSVSVGDTVYFVNTANLGNNVINSNNLDEIGEITSITTSQQIIGGVNTTVTTMKVTTDLFFVEAPTNNSFIFFSKNNINNLSSILGYYGEFKFKNDSPEKGELFSVTVDAFESSK